MAGRRADAFERVFPKAVSVLAVRLQVLTIWHDDYELFRALSQRSCNSQRLRQMFEHVRGNNDACGGHALFVSHPERPEGSVARLCCRDRRKRVIDPDQACSGQGHSVGLEGVPSTATEIHDYSRVVRREIQQCELLASKDTTLLSPAVCFPASRCEACIPVLSGVLLHCRYAPRFPRQVDSVVYGHELLGVKPSGAPNQGRSGGRRRPSRRAGEERSRRRGRSAPGNAVALDRVHEGLGHAVGLGAVGRGGDGSETKDFDLAGC